MEITMDLFIDLLRADGSIIVNKKLARAIGLNEAVLYSELLSKYKYFKDRDRLTDDGFFFNTVDNLELDTTLTGKQQRPIIKKLEKLQLIEMSIRGLPSKRYFKVNCDTKIILNLLQSQENQKECQKVIPRSDQKSFIDGTKGHTNNTNTNNTKINNNKKNKAAESHSAVVDNFSEDALTVFRYFLSQYMKNTGEVHPTVNKAVIDKLNGIMESGCIYDPETDKELYIDIEAMETMIDKYFQTDYPLRDGGFADYRIYHFLSDMVMKNLYYKECY